MPFEFWLIQKLKPNVLRRLLEGFQYLHGEALALFTILLVLEPLSVFRNYVL